MGSNLKLLHRNRAHQRTLGFETQGLDQATFRWAIPGKAFRRSGMAALLGICLLLSAWAPALRDPSTGLRLGDSQAQSLPRDLVPSPQGPVVIVVDKHSGRILYNRQAYRHHAIGSITKLMTAMLAVHRLHLNRIVTVSNKAA